MSAGPAVPPLADVLRDRLVVVNLGAGDDRAPAFPEHLRQAVTLVEIDAANDAFEASAVHRRIPLRRVIADVSGRRVFRENAWVQCSSLLPPRQELVTRYGLEDYFAVVDEREVECVTLVEALHEVGVERADFLKTDIEGLDAAVLRSSEALLDHVLVLQSELRLEPFYEGEATFHDSLAYLDSRGFELVSMRPEEWKPVTRRRDRHSDGRTVWADCVFLRRSELLPGSPEGLAGLAEAKQVLLCAMAGLPGWGEHLLERYAAAIPAPWHADLVAATAPAERRRRVRERAMQAVVEVRRRVPPKPRFTFRHVA